MSLHINGVVHTTKDASLVGNPTQRWDFPFGVKCARMSTVKIVCPKLKSWESVLGGRKSASRHPQTVVLSDVPKLVVNISHILMLKMLNKLLKQVAHFR